ncbi:MAG: TonB-dependent receptor, partial [Rhodospirillaceae bacterium]|nr:TonB-dependent receptor [Rhodospirillaceae bacterium]
GNSQNVNFAELERVEVIPGPQSALFGRSTFGGAVNYITRDPTDEYKVYANASVAEFGDYEASVWAGGPVVEDKLLMSGVLFYQRFKGPDDWLASDGKTHLFYTLSKSGGVKAVATPNDSLRIEARANYYQDDDNPALVGVLSPRGRVGSQGSFNKVVPTISPNPIPVYPLGKVHHIPPTPFTTTAINPAATDIATERRGWRTYIEAAYSFNDYEFVLTGGHQYETTSTGQSVNVQFPNSLIQFVNNPNAGLSQTGAYERVNSIEARLTSPQDQDLRYTVGFFYENIAQIPFIGISPLLNTCLTICTLTETVPNITLNAAGQPNPSFTSPAAAVDLALISQRTNIKDKAPFIGLYYDMTDQVTVAFEARRQWEDRRQRNYVGGNGLAPTPTTPTGAGAATVQFGGCATNQPATVAAPGLVAPLSKDAQDAAPYAPIDLCGTFKSFLPRLNLQFKANDDLQFFAVYSQGNSPGGFNISPFVGVAGTGTTADQRFVKEEDIDNYELGMKSTWLDNRLLFNTSLYHMYWKNLVTAATYFTPPPNSTFFGINENRGTVTMKGIEGELTYIPADGWTLRGTYSYTRSKYVTFCSNNFTLLTGIDDDAGPTACRFVNGNNVDLVPSTRLSAGAGYVGDLSGDWDWFIRGDIQYQSGMWADEFNFAKTYPAWNSNLHIGVENENINFEVFCRNCTDDKEPLRFVRFSDLRGPGSTNTTNQSIGHQPRYPFTLGARIVYQY